MEVNVARQPIFNRKKQLVGYELLFRDNPFQSDTNLLPVDGDSKTSTLLANTFFSIGIERLLGEKLGFINFTRNLLLDKFPLLLPKETIVVEILEDIEPDSSLVDACRDLAEKGYTLALDDFVYNPEIAPLIELAKIIKFDFLLSSNEEITHCLQYLPENNKPTLLAEKIETYEEFNTAQSMGFALFQGYFFCRPEVIKGTAIPEASFKLLEVIAEVNRDDFDIDKLDSLIAPDISITYKLLRYINSAYYSLNNPISSVQQALAYLGQKEIRRFISMIALSNLAEEKPSELARSACFRGKFCESLASISPENVSEQEAFTLGLLSLIDAFIEQPMEVILEALPLEDRIKSALTNDNCELGSLLKLVEYYEKGQWSEVTTLSEQIGIEEKKLPELYLHACLWSNSMTGVS